MKVLFYTPGWPLEDFSNGIVGYIDRLLPELHKRGIRTRLVAGSLGAHHQGDAVASDAAWSKLGPLGRLTASVLFRAAPNLVAADVTSRARLYLAGRAISKSLGVDIVEMEETLGLASALARGAAAPLIMRLHGPAFLNLAANGQEATEGYNRRVSVEGKAIAAADAVTSPASDVLDRVRERYQLELKDAVVIPNAGPEPVPEHEWNLREAEPGHVLFIGRFDRHKGGDIIIEAFAKLLKTHPHAKLSFAGQDVHGLLDDAGKHWRIEEFVADRLGERRDRVDILGRVPNQQLAALRKSASVVVQPSRYEVSGIAVLEACSQGVPLVVTNIGGPIEIVRQGHGLKFPLGDRDALADCLRRILDTPELAARMGQGLLADYRRRFLPAIVAQQTCDFYAEVHAKHGRG